MRSLITAGRKRKMMELENISDSGAIPASRVKNPVDAADMVRTMIRADEQRSAVRAKVKGLVDGNAPYNPSDLRKNGQSFRTNVNWREAETFLGMACSAFYDVFSEVPHFATIKVEHGDPDDSSEYSRIITEEFDKLQRDDHDFDYLMQLSQHEMVLYGTGPILFEDSLDWRCRPIKSGNLLVPDGSKSNVSDFEVAVVRNNYAVHELYSFIRKEEAAVNAGWNLKEAKRAIADAAPAGENGNKADWEYYQQQIRNNDLAFSSKCDTVPVAHIFYREHPTDEYPEGAISHCMIAEGSAEPQFLFRKQNRYEGWEQCLHVFFYDKGDGNYHACKGLGVKMYSPLELKNRLRCTLVDAAIARSAIHFKADSPNDLNKASFVQMGPYSLTPSGFNVVQTTSAGVLDAPMAVQADLEGVLQSNLSQYRQNLEKGGNPRTATEIDAIVSQQSTLGKTQLNRYYRQLDSFFKERYRRASNPDLTEDMAGGVSAIKFQKACIDRGVPRAALTKIISVAATRTTGQGSAMERRAISNQLMNVLPMLPETGRTRVIEDHIASLAGHHNVKRYYPTPEEDIDQQEQQQEAVKENILLKQGMQIPVAGGDMHAVHLEVHLAAGQEIAQIAGQADPSELGQYLSLMVQHCAAHLMEIEKDATRKSLVDEYSAILKELQSIADQLMQEAQRAAEAEQQAMAEQQQAMAEMQAIQGGMDPKDQLAQARFERDEARRDAKTENDISRKERKMATDIAIKDAKSATDLANKDLKQNL